MCKKMSYIQAVRSYRGQGQLGSQTHSDREEQCLAVEEETEREKPEPVQQEPRRRSVGRGQPRNAWEEGVGD